MVVKNIEEQFIDVMFDIEDENQVIENYGELRKFLIFVASEEIASPYDYITEYVFNHRLDNPDEATIMFDYLRAFYLSTDGEKNDYVDTVLKSITRHIRLAIIQQEYIAKQTEQTIKANQTLRNNLAHQNYILKEMEIKIDNIKVDKSSIYTDFIAILGIFSALIFGLFGGFSAFTNILQAMSSNTKISRAILMGSLLLMGLLILIFLLMNGISSLTDKNFKSCCVNDVCEHSLYDRFPIFVLGISTLFIVCIGAFLGMVWNLEGDLYDNPLVITIIIIIGLILLVVFARKKIFISHIKQKKS